MSDINLHYGSVVFCAQAAQPRHRNSAAPGANLIPGYSLEAGAPAKAAYAMTVIISL